MGAALESRHPSAKQPLWRLGAAAGRAGGRLAYVVDRLDEFDTSWLLGANTALALLLLAAYGGGLLLTHLSGGLSGNLVPSPFPPALAAMVALAFTGVASFLPAARSVALKAHGLLFTGIAAYLIYCSVIVIVDGVPMNARLSWDPLLFTVLAAYSVYLARRLFLPAEALRNALLKYSHAVVLVLSALISALVLWRVYAGAT